MYGTSVRRWANRRREDAWNRQYTATVRSACIALSESPDCVMRSISVSVSAADANDPAALANRASLIAEEYGLRASTRLEGRALTIQLSRHGGQDSIPGGATTHG